MSPDTAVARIKNLDVLGLDQEPKFGGNKGRADAIAPDPLLSSLGAHTAQLSQGHEHRCYRDGGTKYISVLQATNHRGGRFCEIDQPPLGCPSLNRMVADRCGRRS